MTVPDNFLPIVTMRDLPPEGGDRQTPVQECIANISEEERLKRLIPGITGMVLAVIILGIMMATGVDRFWRIGLFFLFAGAASGIFQARDRT
jgi:uncharacterized membrane protein HdeD (DUF308 family)